MCGITGYMGFRNASNIILEGLKRLEYRGYDSSGVGIIGDKLLVFKEVGEIRNLEKNIPEIHGRLGIGHTRWATHGGVCKENAHPQLSCNKRIAVVHNGIIENFKELKEELQEGGHRFLSETDTEVISHLIEENYKGDLEDAVRDAIKKLSGSYSIVVISDLEPDKLICARKESPLVIGMGDKENFVASDIPAFLKYTNRVKYLHDGDICILTGESVSITDVDGNTIDRDEELIEWDAEEAEKGGFEHYMLKEIYEQPHCISETLRGRISEVEPWIQLEIGNIEDIDKITLIACGTSYYSCMAGKYIIENLAGIPVNVERSSEYRYFGRKSGVVLAVTQSGETADTLAALREAKKHGCRTMAIINVIGSSATRIADRVILTRAGPEIGVAATKTFTAQIVTFFLLALSIGMKNGNLKTKEVQSYVSYLRQLPGVTRKVLGDIEKIKDIAKVVNDKQTAFFIGRGINYPIALEGALKLKEISYMHAEGFAGGELKHGPFALLTKRTPVVAIVSKDVSYKKMLGNIGEVKARNSPVISIAEEGDDEIEKFSDYVIYHPPLPPLFSSIPITVILQLLAYYTANYKGRSIDKPRNLAKSVTVE